MNFGEALDSLKSGKRVTRTGWNDHSMLLYFAPCTAIDKIIANENGLVPYDDEYIVKKTSDGTVTPWIANQTDFLSDDWEIVYDFDMMTILTF